MRYAPDITDHADRATTENIPASIPGRGVPAPAGREAEAEESGGGNRVFLTFDDGPIPESTPLLLDILDRHGVKATFFMVGDNARKYPELLEEVKRRGHAIGNHTMHHLQGAKVSEGAYLQDVALADALLHSRLFRPPHGWLRPGQLRRLRERYDVIMYDLITRDYSSRLSAEDVLENVKRYVRDGSIIVFHDSLKSLPRTPLILGDAIEWLRGQGYRFEILSPGCIKF